MLFALTACGGGGGGGAGDGTSGAPMLSGRIADGYINGATVFWDCNGNMTLDADEPSTTSGPGGEYHIAPSPTPKAPLLACSLRAKIPGEAIDEDTGASVGTPYMMSAVDGQPQFISPITTLQSIGLYSESELKRKFPDGAFLPVGSDYMAAGDSGRQQHNAAKYIAIALQSVNGLIATDDAQVRRDALGRAMAYVPSEAFTTLNATPSALAAFLASTPKLDQAINPVSATLERGDFTLVESAFSGPNDPRRKYVQMALDSITKYRDVAVVGSNVYWGLIPNAERTAWSSQIVGGSNGFTDSDTVNSVRSILLAAQQKATEEIEAERGKVVKKMATVFAKNAADMTITSIDSAVKLLPASSLISRSLGITKINKIKLNATRVTTYLNKIGGITKFTNDCADLAADLVFIDSLGELTETGKIVDVAVSLGKCSAGLAKAEKISLIFEDIAAGKAFGEGAEEGSLIEMLKALSDATAALMDAAGLSTASAIYSETLGMFIASVYSVHDLNKTSMKASTVFEEKTKGIIANFLKVADAAGSAMVSARLSPYIQPKHSINIELPIGATVGQPIGVDINQRLPQSFMYKINWGDYPNGKQVNGGASNWTSGSGGGYSTSLAATYTMPGNYDVTIELYDMSLGGAVVPFQILGKTIAVSCPSGTTVNPDGDCVAMTITPSLAIAFTDKAGAVAKGWDVTSGVTFVDGRNGGRAAKFGGTGNPGHIRVPNNASLMFTNEATFDLWARIDASSGMNGYGQSVSSNWAMSLLAKSHDVNGVALLTYSEGVGFATYDATWSGAGCRNIPLAAPPGIGEWYRVTATVSQTTGTKTYINGKLYGECPNARPSFSQMNMQDLYIGKYSDYWYPLNGAIQDVRIYQKALSQAEVQSLP